MAHVKIFLSAVSAEFRSYRDALRRVLTRPNVTVRVQEDFIVTGTETLDLLDLYIGECNAVIHLVGDMTGAMAQASSVGLLCKRYPDFALRLPVEHVLESGGASLSYTQWEAWLALYHRKELIIAVPEEGAARDADFRLNELQRAAQRAHLKRLASFERFPGIHFPDAIHLAVDVLRSPLHDILALAAPDDLPQNLTYASLGRYFKGREGLLDELTGRLGQIEVKGDGRVVALTGLGGIGKTRLALEYAWRRADDYSARLLVGADGAEALTRNLAALCGAAILNLPEKSKNDEGKQRDAVLAWLRHHPGFLLILDNVDTESAARAVEALLPKLAGGHVLITSRRANWSGAIDVLPVDLLASTAAVEFLMERTGSRRRKGLDAAEDLAAADKLAEELGYLALALEQAAAYIATRRLGFTQYLTEWGSRRDEVLDWFDACLMPYPKSVAITWLTTFDELSPAARRLLQRLAWLAPAPIPEALLEVPVPELDPFDLDALIELESYALVTRFAMPDFGVHPLVQEVTRNIQRDDRGHTVLKEALKWMDGAFVGDPQDVRSWPVLEPLAAHARAVAGYADAADIPDPTARLLAQAGALLLTKSQPIEAEPLIHRALVIDEARYGADHPIVATGLNNLATLLQSTSRLSEAEPLMRRDPL